MLAERYPLGTNTKTLFQQIKTFDIEAFVSVNTPGYVPRNPFCAAQADLLPLPPDYVPKKITNGEQDGTSPSCKPSRVPAEPW